MARRTSAQPSSFRFSLIIDTRANGLMLRCYCCPTQSNAAIAYSIIYTTTFITSPQYMHTYAKAEIKCVRIALLICAFLIDGSLVCAENERVVRNKQKIQKSPPLLFHLATHSLIQCQANIFAQSSVEPDMRADTRASSYEFLNCVVVCFIH